jgi:hypothetical protein
MASDSDGGVDRRQFLRSCGCALAGIAALGVAPIVSGCEFSRFEDPTSNGGGGGGGNGDTVEIDVSGLVTDGTAVRTDKIVREGGRPYYILVSRISATEYRAMSNRCRHSDFHVDTFPGGEPGFWCTGGQGHGSTFDIRGIVRTGPALTVGDLTVLPSEYVAARKVLVVTVG